MLLALMVSIPTGMAATEEDINDSINAGVAWLVAQQDPDDGSWGDYEKVAYTGFAVLKLEDRSREWGYEPLDEDGPYYDNITAGLDYIESQMVNVDITGNLADKNGNDKAITFPNFHQTYNTGIALMALANADGPDDHVYKVEVQDMVDWFILTQNPDGGWAYPAYSSDNSNTGYAVLGLAYAEDAGADVDDVKLGVDSWIDHIQNQPGSGDDGGESDPDGGSGYSVNSSWVNCLKTGNLIFEMGFVGDDMESERLQNATDYLERHWNDANPDPGWRPHHYQAMYTMMKGLESYGIETLEVGGSDVEWFDNFSTVIVDTQNVADGSWPADNWGDSMLSTVWALLTLEKVTIDRTPPEVWCIETVNPHGKNVPPAGSTTLPGPKGGQNEDGFYELFAEDNKDPNPEIFVVVDIGSDNVLGTDDDIKFGPFESGTKIKYTEANGAKPSIKEMGSDKGKAGAIDWHIKGQGDMILMAIDDSGNVGSCDCCLVPPKPK